MKKRKRCGICPFHNQYLDLNSACSVIMQKIGKKPQRRETPNS